MIESIIPMIRVRRSAWFAVGALLLCASAGAQPGSDQVTALCTACHSDMFETTARNPHGFLESADWRARTGNTPGCSNCHGDASEHVRARGGRGNVFAFRDEPASAQNERCLTCHRDSHPEFDHSTNALAGLTCSGCHSQHSANASATALLRPAVQATDLTGPTGGAVPRRKDLDLGMEANERSDGTGFTGVLSATDVSAAATIGRNIDFDEIDAKLDVSERP